MDNFELQRVRVQKVLLVCSDYDSYTFEEEGLLNELVYQWYAEHSLSKPPVIDRVSSPEAGVRRSSRSATTTTWSSRSRAWLPAPTSPADPGHSPGTPICLLALTPSELTSSVALVDDSDAAQREQAADVGDPASTRPRRAGRPRLAQAGSVGADAWIWPFMWQGSPSLFTAMFKAVEDRINVAADAEYGVQTIMVVEDSVKFYSSFLPTLYSEIWRQNAEIAGETMHMRERIMRLHSRPKVLFCTNYEEAMDVYDRYRDNMFGVITDLGFPRTACTRRRRPQVRRPRQGAHARAPRPRAVVAAVESQYAEAARSLGCKFVCKTSPTLLQSLRDYFRDDLLFGPLKFQDGVTGEQLGAVSNVSELAKTWAELPLSSVGYHARHSHLSRWFFARAEFELAKRFRASQYPQDFIDATGRERPDWLRNWILSEVRAHRNKLASTVENVQAADATTPIVRLGSGSLGGKGRGFRFLHNLSDKINMSTRHPRRRDPRAALLHPRHVRLRRLHGVERPADRRRSTRRRRGGRGALRGGARCPRTRRATLQTFLETTSGPLAVRSSSLFEDAFMQPFAGIYSSCMLPNSDASPMEERLAELERAVKTVYASTFSREARVYAESMSNRTEEEKMAVILQPLVGETDADGRYFYPTLAGVANSVDFYPLPHTSSVHGCAQIGLGLGSAVVDNAPAVHFSLGDPWTLTGYDESALTVTALDLTRRPRPAEKNLTSLEDALVEQSR